MRAQETETVLTRAFDVGQRIPWPEQYPGRALRNHFTDQWHYHTDQLAQNEAARQQLAEAIKSGDYRLAHIYAGEAVGLVNQQRPAGEVIKQLSEGAELLLSERWRQLQNKA